MDHSPNKGPKMNDEWRNKESTKAFTKSKINYYIVLREIIDFDEKKRVNIVKRMIKRANALTII